jgi:protoporphyrinogen oxidase
MNIGILGGGLSGITFQKHLSHSSEILEKEDKIGGLCRSFEKSGFTYDIGGHILFSKDKTIMDIIKNTLNYNINYCRRNNKIIYKDRFVKYPFENELCALDKEDTYECLTDYIINNNPKPENFKEWIYYTFGKGIAEKYLVPYNQKIWKTDLCKMSLEWVERIPKPPVQDIIKSALGIETEGYTHQLNFLYPKTGGIESLISSMQDTVKKKTTNYEIKEIRKKENSWVVSDEKEKKEFDKIVITFPLKEAIRCFNNVPDIIINAVSELRHNMVKVVFVGLNNESLLDKSAIYVPQEDVCFHRLCYMGYFSKNNVPNGKSSVIAEITTNMENEYYRMDDSLIIEKVIDDLQKLHLINQSDISVTDVKSFEYGYIVYDKSYYKNINLIKQYFQSIGVTLLGRFGEFEYINMDEVIKRSIGLAKEYNSKDM